MVLTNKQKYNRKYGFKLNEGHTLNEISATTGVSTKILNEVAKRASGAWRTNLASVRLKTGEKNPDIKKFPRNMRMSREAWIMGRLYSFVVGGGRKRQPIKIYGKNILK
jgi:hypothetical protein